MSVVTNDEKGNFKYPEYKKHLTFSGKARSVSIVFTSDAEVRGFLQTTNNEYSMKIFKPTFLFINIPVNCQKVKNNNANIIWGRALYEEIR